MKEWLGQDSCVFAVVNSTDVLKLLSAVSKDFLIRIVYYVTIRVHSVTKGVHSVTKIP